MTTNTLDLYCDNITSRAESFDFGEGYTSDWDVIRNEYDDSDAEKLFELADDYGVSLWDDPRELSRDEIVSGLESIGVACFDEESTGLLAIAYADSMLAGDLPGDAASWSVEVADAVQDYPMMNYRYPVKLRNIDPHKAAEKLDGLPLCLVECLESGEYYFALTGGGMDLTAEIARAYIAVGQRPPVEFCRVPRMAGRKYSAEFLAVLRESCVVAQNWAQSTIDDLERIAADPDYSEAANNV